ncbi:hypothetical protein ALT_7476 [Aspergillus lentulus]|uniref:Uncharacterized protein n=1 Tax=Aspergillus lentulus TaxID=293939 RepID=A0AAN4PNP9_ASPLE|nr:hypothetical protein ALT_7476 [Aspergillus lentulus]
MGARAAGHRANGADRAGPTSPRRGGVPSEPVRTQVIPSDRPRGRWRAAAYGPRVGGPDPADTPTKGGSRGAAPPGNLGIRTGQRPTIHRLHRCRGPNGPRASVIPAMWGSRAFLSTARNEPGTGARRMSRGSRARPLLDAPNTVDSLDDPTKDAARRPLESRNHGWDGRLPPEAACLAGKKWPAQSSHATRGDAALAFHIEPPTSTGPTSCVQTFPGPDPAGGGPILYGVVRASTRAPIQSGPLWFARCLGRKGTWSLAPSCARARGRSWPTAPAPWPHSIPALTSVLFINYISALPLPPPTGLLRARGPLLAAGGRAPANWSLPRRAPPASIDPSAWRAPANWSLPGRARARPLSTPASVSVCLYKCLSMARPPACWSAPPPPRAPANWPPSRARPHPDPSTPGSGPPRGASHRANSASQLATALPHRALTGAPPPPSPSPSPSSPRPPPPRHPRARTPAGPRRRRPLVPITVRARGSLPATRARAPAQLPSTSTWTPRWPPACLPACLPRAPPTALLLHIPTDPDRPAIVRANVPGSESRSGGRPTCAGSPRASRAAMCPGQLATALRHQAAARAGPCCRSGRARGHLGRPTGVGPWRWRSEGTGRRRSPRVSPEKGVWPPSKRPALPDPLQQGYLTAYTTRLVTSVVCRGFIPARGDIAIRQPAPGGFSPGAVASLLRCMARRPIRIQLRRAGLHRRVPARILT